MNDCMYGDVGMLFKMHYLMWMYRYVHPYLYIIVLCYCVHYCVQYSSQVLQLAWWRGVAERL